MDFLYLELLRQRRALAALLLGSQKRPAEAFQWAGPCTPQDALELESLDAPRNEALNRRELPPMRSVEDAGAWRDALSGDGTPFGNADRLQNVFPELVSGENAVRRPWTASNADGSFFQTPLFQAPALRGRAVPVFSGWQDTPLAFAAEGGGLGSGGKTMEGTAWLPEQAQSAGVLLESPAGPAGSVLRAAGFPELSAETEMAKAMSLAFQRDARRYDGGFLSSS